MSLTRTLKTMLRIVPLFLFLVLFLTIVNSILLPVSVLALQNFIDRTIEIVTNKTSIWPVLLTFLIIVGIYMFRQYHSVVEEWFFVRSKQKVTKHYASLIIAKMQRIEYSNIENQNTYDLIHRVKAGIEKNTTGFVLNLKNIVAVLIEIVGVMVVMQNVSTWILISILAIFLLTIVLAYKFGAKRFNVSIEYERLDREMDYFEALFKERNNALEIRLFHASSFIKNFFSKAYNKQMHLYFVSELYQQLNFVILMKFIGYILLFSVYIMLAFSLYHNEITIGFYIAIIVAISQMVHTITNILPSSLQAIVETKLYWKDANHFFELSETTQTESDRKDITQYKEITFQDVYFKYPGEDQYVLKGINLRFARGNHYALVGANGSGKSTLIKLLIGLFKPDKGKILIDGNDIYTLPKTEIFKLFSVIFQDFNKHNATILENITMGTDQETIDRSRLDSITKSVGIDDKINSLPDGYNTLLGKLFEEGVDLSGGEWQKIGICKLLYHNAPIRIFDEPTSALDPIAETEVYRTLQDLVSDDSTTVLISHRLGSTKISNHIIVLDDGTVIEEGTHAELMASKQLYHKMFTAQKQWYEVNEDRPEDIA